MSWLDDLISGTSKGIDLFAKVKKIRRAPVRPVRRAPVRRAPVRPVTVQKSFVQQNQTQLLAVAGLLALLLVVRK